MTLLKSILPIAAFASLPLLSACGGGATTGAAAVTMASATPATALSAVSLNTSAETTAVAATTNSAVTTDAGSTLSTGMVYIAGLTSAGNGLNTIAGLQTTVAGMPTAAGTLTYNGKGKATIVHAGVSYVVDMTAQMVADIQNGDADLTLSTVAAGGTQQAGVNPAVVYVPTGSEQVTVTDMTITGATLGADGSTSMASTGFGAAGATNASAAAGTVSAAGIFAGPSAEEVGGAAISNSGAITVTFTAKQ